MKHNKGFMEIWAIVIIILLIIVLGFAYQVVSNFKITLPTAKPIADTQTKNTIVSTEGSFNSKGECNTDFTPPTGSLLGDRILVTPTVFAVSWRYPHEQYISLTRWEYAIFECTNGIWRKAYSSPKDIEIESIVLSLLPHDSILVAENHSGAGTATEWSVLYKNGGAWTLKSGANIRNQALKELGYVYMGYNGVNVENGNIVEYLPGYKEGDSRCCPTSAGRAVTYSWNGSGFSLLSTK